jgi:hypothetical protein
LIFDQAAATELSGNPEILDVWGIAARGIWPQLSLRSHDFDGVGRER